MPVMRMLPKWLLIAAKYVDEQLEIAQGGVEWIGKDLDGQLALESENIRRLLPPETARFVKRGLRELREELTGAKAELAHWERVWSALAVLAGVSPQELKRLVGDSDRSVQ